jgi:hypothetical protein
VGVAFVPGGQPAVAEQPGDTAFDHPSVLAEFLAGFDAFAGDAGRDSSLTQPSAQFGDVISLMAWSLVGRVRRGPRRERTAGMALTKGLSA